MNEYPEHNPTDHEDPLPGPSWLVGLIGAVLLIVIVLGLTSLFYGAQKEEEQLVVLDVKPTDLESLKKRQEARLTGEPHWEVTIVDNKEIDRRIIIPISDAVQKVVEEYGQKQ